MLMKSLIAVSLQDILILVISVFVEIKEPDMEERLVDNPAMDEEITINDIEWDSPIEDHIAVSLKEGSILGNITNIYLDTENKKISAFEFRKNFWSEKYFVRVDNVSYIGKEIIFIKEKDSVEPISNFDKSSHRNLKDLRGTRVTTMAGNLLGELEDIDINPKTFEINELCLDIGFVLPIEVSEVTIGKDEILVPAEYESFMVRDKKVRGILSQSHTGGFITNLSKKIYLGTNKDKMQ